MADITITATSVQAVSGAETGHTAGATITAGQPCYLDTADGSKAKPAHRVTSALTATVAGIALNNASDEQRVKLLTGGSITIGATVVKGTIYCLSDSGNISPVADLASSDWVSTLGVASDTATLSLSIFNSGIQI